MAQEKRYVDVDLLKMNLLNFYPSTSSSYSSDPISSAVNTQINTALVNFACSMKNQLIEAIERSSQPYSQCMLCVRKEGQDLPPNLGCSS
jgi:hypothetical protein